MRRGWPILSLGLLLGVAVLATPFPAGANHSLLRRISTGPAETNGTFATLFGGASSSGDKVFFRTAEPLVAGDTDGQQDIYQRTAADSSTSLVSTGPSGGNGAFAPSYSGNSPSGNDVYFTTLESLSAGDTDTSQDVYERRSGTSTLQVSTAPSSGNGAFPANFEGASSDGNRVFFSTLEPLVAADTDTSRDVYQRTTSGAGATALISTGPAGGNGAFDASFRGTSADGSIVFFTTSEQLTSADTDSSADLYMRSGTTTTLISTGPAGGNGAFNAAFTGASQDGSRVFFTTAESLVAGDTDAATDIYQRSGTTTTLISTGPAGGNGAIAASFGDISLDGTHVFFTTPESLVAGDTDTAVDLYDRSGGTTTLLSTGTTGGNGAFGVVFTGNTPDGANAYFLSLEPLVAGDTDTSQDVYAHAGGVTTLVSTGPAGGNGVFKAFFSGASDDGSRVFFVTGESLVAGDNDTNSQDVYERFAGTTTQISVGGTFAVNDPLAATFRANSPDGSRVLFDTAEALAPGDVDNQSVDVYEKTVPVAGYARPKGATPTRVALVPAYRECTDPNTVHQSPVSNQGCNPPVPVSQFLTVGTPDANGQNANSVGSLRMDVIVGNPSTPADEADIALKLSLSDVRNASNLSDYTGQVQAATELRITDKANAPPPDPTATTLSATVQDLTLRFTATCAATADTTVGGTCSVTTTAKAVMPGIVREGKRAIYKLGEVDVFDGGSDGDVGTAGNTLFAWQGLFVP